MIPAMVTRQGEVVDVVWEGRGLAGGGEGVGEGGAAAGEEGGEAGLGEGGTAGGDEGAGGEGAGGVPLPPGYCRGEEVGRDGKRKRFLVCPGGKRFERWQAVKLLQKKGKFLELKEEHFQLVMAKKTGKPRETPNRGVEGVVIADINNRTANKLTARRKQLKRSLDDFDEALGAGEVDHEVLLEEAAVMLMDFRDQVWCEECSLPGEAAAAGREHHRRDHQDP